MTQTGSPLVPETTLPAEPRRDSRGLAGGVMRRRLALTPRPALLWKKDVEGRVATWLDVEPLNPGGAAAALGRRP